MSDVAGIHLCDRECHAVILRGGHTTGLVAARASRLETAFTVQALQDRPASFTDALVEAAEGRPVRIVLPCGFFHAKKVPLEVADEAGRRSQIHWEVEQALVEPATEFEVSTFAVGSAAVWFAVRRTVSVSIASLLERAGLELDSLCPAPLAAFRACVLAGEVGPRRRGILHLGSEWTAFAAYEGRTLASAEVIRHGSNDDTDSLSGPGVGAAARRWVLGRGARPSRDTCDDLFVCGDVSDVIEGRAVALDPFSACDGDPPENPSRFALAAGAAYGPQNWSTS